MLGLGNSVSITPPKAQVNIGSAYGDSNTHSLNCEQVDASTRKFMRTGIGCGSASGGITTSTANPIWRASHAYSMWVRFDDGQPTLAEAIFGMASDGNNNMILAQRNTTGTLSFIIRAGGSSNLYFVATDVSVFANGQTGWHHLVFNIVADDGSGNLLTELWVDGNKPAQTTSYTITATQYQNFTFDDENSLLSHTFAIGAMPLGYTYFFLQSLNGQIDEFAMLTRRLYLDEIKALYNNGVPKNFTSGGVGDNQYIPASDVYLKYTFNNNTVNAGSAGSNANGTIVNSATYNTDSPND